METRSRNESLIDGNRITIGALVVLAVISGLVMRLWYLQILRGEDFLVAAERNRLREVPRLAPRGLIFDRDGALMLANRNFFDLVVIPQYLTEREKTFKMLGEIFHLEVEHIEKRLAAASSLPNFAPVAIKKNLSLHEVALVESLKFFLPGVDVETKPRRAYERNESAHLLGYLDEISERELQTFKNRFPDSDYEAQSVVGKLGVEKKYERYLRGQKGIEYLQVDALGRLQNTKGLPAGFAVGRQAKRGYDLYLTIDKDIQDAALEAFKNKNGALVAMNPSTGEILAYVSNPGFSLSTFQEGLSSEDWQSLQSNPFKPLLDKVTGGAYPPASTYKLVTAVAALEEGVVGPKRVYNCDGSFTLGSGRWRCWKRTGHGPVDLYDAMAKSCDIWFYQVGNLLGVDRIAKWAKLLGFGEKTGFDLNMELPGIVPTSAWKLRNRGMPWLQGDTINVAIGQGYNLATPMQVLAAYAAVASGGRLYKPYVLKSVVNDAGQVVELGKPELVREVPLSPSTLAVLKASFERVVDSPTGTAHGIKTDEFEIAGKTGTAQNAATKRTRDTENIQLLQRNHAWFAAYSPYENSQIAVVVLSEYDGGGGASQAAPIARDVIEAYWRKQDPVRFASRDAREQQELRSSREVLSFQQQTGEYAPEQRELEDTEPQGELFDLPDAWSEPIDNESLGEGQEEPRDESN